MRGLKTASAVVVLAVCLASCGYVHPRHLSGVRPGPPVSVGVNTDITWGIPAADVDREVSLIRRGRVGWIRASVDLSNVEPAARGQLDMSYMHQLDSQISIARRAKLNVLLELDRAPYWASADPHKHTDGSGSHWNYYWTYSDPHDYARIVTALVRRYMRLGVRAYELWSEPNFPKFWPSGVDAAAYTKLLAAAYPAIKRADAHAVVVMGGLSNLGVYRYLGQLYEAGAARFYDVANFHIYPSGKPADCAQAGGKPSDHSFCALDRLRSEMLARGDRKPAWITEIGWSTCRTSRCVPPQTQAAYIKQTFGLLSDRNYAWVKAAFVYAMRDIASSGTDWGGFLGLVTRSFVPKPSYFALAEVASM